MGEQDWKDLRSGALRQIGALAVLAVVSAGGAALALNQKLDPFVALILIGIAVFVGFFAIALFLDWRDERKSRSRWSSYDFYRDTSNEALAIGTRNVLNPGNAFDVAVDHGILLGKVDPTLRANGLGHEADAIYPYKTLGMFPISNRTPTRCSNIGGWFKNCRADSLNFGTSTRPANHAALARTTAL